jgi:hypothetical protein
VSDPRCTVSAMDDDPRAALIYESAVRTLDQQASLLANIQTRAGTLLTAASIATLFLAGLAIEEGEGLTVFSGIASALFLVVVGSCVWILTPTKGWRFRFEADRLVFHIIDAEQRQMTLADVHRDLALQKEKWAGTNEKKLNTLALWLRSAALALGIEVILWIADLLWGGEL